MEKTKTVQQEKKIKFSDLTQIFREHRHFGRQTFVLAKNELVKMYKGAILGPFWAVVKPLFQLFIYWFAFEFGIRGGGSRDMHGVTFFVFLMVGFIPWFFISDTIVNGSKSIRNNRQFVTKVSFPVSIIMTYTTLAKLFVHIFLMVLCYIYLVCTGYTPNIYNLQFFFYCPLMFIFFVMLLWSTAPMSAFSKDFESLIVAVMSGFFWISGIMNISYEIENDFVRHLMLVNPITFFVNGYRKTFLNAEWYNEWFFENQTELLIFVAELVFIYLIGVYNYSRLRKRLPDVL